MIKSNQTQNSRSTSLFARLTEALLLGSIAAFCLVGGVSAARDSATWERGIATSTSNPATIQVASDSTATLR